MRTASHIALLGLLASVAAVMLASSAGAMHGCIDCHKALPDERLSRPARKIDDDYHVARGLSCQHCHGGDHTAGTREQGHSRTKGFLGRPARQRIPEFCGKCHSDPRYMRKFDPSIRTDQVTEYYTSVHGQKLREGDRKVAVCISCHDVHAIRAVKDQAAWTYPIKVAETCARCHGDANYMKEYKIPTDQFEKYRHSVHFDALAKRGDLSAPTCSTCHGNHGAAPPGVDAVANVCSTCHAATADLFAKSAHKEAFADLGMPACVTCHSNHDVLKPSDDMLAGGDETPCATCHEANSPPLQKAAEVRSLLGGLSTRIDEAEAILMRAEHAGMEVGPYRFELIAAKDSLIKARAETHTLQPSRIRAITDEGVRVAEQSVGKGQELMAELQFRRKGLAASLVVIAVVLIGLFLKIREVDRRHPPD
jgi:hypothetical protein